MNDQDRDKVIKHIKMCGEYAISTLGKFALISGPNAIMLYPTAEEASARGRDLKLDSFNVVEVDEELIAPASPA